MLEDGRKRIYVDEKNDAETLITCDDDDVDGEFLHYTLCHAAPHTFKCSRNARQRESHRRALCVHLSAAARRFPFEEKSDVFDVWRSPSRSRVVS